MFKNLINQCYKDKKKNIGKMIEFDKIRCY